MELFFRGTFFPFDRASDRPIAIACFLLFTFRPLLDLSVPFLRRRIALSTSLLALSEYFRFDDFFAAIFGPSRLGTSAGAVRAKRTPAHDTTRG